MSVNRKHKYSDIFSKQLATAMKMRGFNQAQLANQAAVSQATVSGWLNGSIAGGAELHLTSIALGVSMQWLLTGRDQVLIPSDGKDWRARALAAEAELKRLKAKLRGLTEE